MIIIFLLIMFFLPANAAYRVSWHEKQTFNSHEAVLTGATKSNQKQFSSLDLSEYKGIIQPVIKYQGSKFILFGKDESKIINQSEVDWDKANIMRSQILEKEKLLDLHKKNQSGDNFTEELLYVSFASDKVAEGMIGDRGVIKNLCDKPLKLYFHSETDKQAVYNDPFKKAFIVSGATLLNDKGNPDVYKITKIHKTIDREG